MMPTRQPSSRPIEPVIISRKIASTQSAASAPAAAYRASSRRRIGVVVIVVGLLAVGVDHRLALGPRGGEPVGRHLLADRAQLGLERGGARVDLHALGCQLLQVFAVALLAQTPATRLGRRGGLQ